MSGEGTSSWEPQRAATRAGVAAIVLRGLAKRYGRNVAVRDLTLDVYEGEIFGFLGLNGAGKTTTIRILLDLLRPTAGTASVFGLDCQRDSKRCRSMIGYLPGELGLAPDLTGQATLDLLAALSGTPTDRGYRAQLAERLELSAADLARPVREYSTGMKRKLGLIQALQADPPLLILDEPTDGLDLLVQRALHDLLFELRARGRTVFMSSHVLSHVERVCDRVAVIRRGTVVLLSTVDDARRLSGRTVRVTFRVPVPTPKSSVAAGGTQSITEPVLPADARLIEATTDRWVVRVPGPAGDLLAAIMPLPVADIEIEEPALEDVLASFYRERHE